MAKRMNANDQFKFLLSCVKWSNNGKVDFAEVARECGVVSKAAAAKRYERMLKVHCIHPHGRPLESLSILRERSTCAMKASKKRKLSDTSLFMHHSEFEGQKPQMPQQSPQRPGPHNIKQEPPSMGYQPYVYHPMMSHQPPLVRRPMPHFVPQDIGAMSRSTGAPQLYPMMPAMPHNNHLTMPLHHQMPPFSTNQSLPLISYDQDQNSFNSFNDYYNSNITKCKSFEGQLNRDSGMANDICDTADSASIVLARPNEHNSTNSSCSARKARDTSINSTH